MIYSVYVSYRESKCCLSTFSLTCTCSGEAKHKKLHRERIVTFDIMVDYQDDSISSSIQFNLTFY